MELRCSDLGLGVVSPLGDRRLIEYGIAKFDFAGQGFVPICDYTVQENATPRLGGVRNAGVLLCQALASEYAIGFREMRTSKGVNARTSCHIEGGY